MRGAPLEGSRRGLGIWVERFMIGSRFWFQAAPWLLRKRRPARPRGRRPTAIERAFIGEGDFYGPDWKIIGVFFDCLLIRSR